MYPEIPLPPKPILTRWGTWLEAVEYYAEHIDSINNVLLALDSSQLIYLDISVKNDLAHIQHTFSCIIKTLKSLQNRHLSLSESFEIINSTVEQLNRGRGKVADAVRAKVDTVLSKTLDMKNYKKVVAVMSGESTVKINLDLSPADIVKLNYVPVTSCDVERSFSQYKSILRDNRRRFTFQHLKEMRKLEERSKRTKNYIWKKMFRETFYFLVKNNHLDLSTEPPGRRQPVWFWTVMETGMSEDDDDDDDDDEDEGERRETRCRHVAYFYGIGSRGPPGLTSPSDGNHYQ
ncbi:hypothetical protein ANN_10393 [Periplaneta americana]|uniref:Uncharacterized protein n=1 Tax=Periplaneta americana TaxID=6978 RepID=A0ABQ8TP57_PERAM|nr:hypothetical protein ANN_10393 [Periplaneta americana]